MENIQALIARTDTLIREVAAAEETYLTKSRELTRAKRELAVALGLTDVKPATVVKRRRKTGVLASVRTMLAKNPDGIRAKVVVNATGLNALSVATAFRQLVQRGEAVKVERGLYAPAPAPVANATD